MRIASQNPDERMPPVESGRNKKLSASEIELLTRWIAEGAAWSAHWAYTKPQRHSVPPVRGRLVQKLG
jgi:hypothetical protein